MRKLMVLLAMGVFVAGGSVMTTGCGDEAGDADADSDADTDADTDGDSDGDSDGDTDADSDADSDSDTESETDTRTGEADCPDGSEDYPSTCEEYCACMEANCGDVNFEGGCMATCEGLDQGDVCDQQGANLECRHYHCEAAPSDAAFHCPHAAGESVCVD